MTERGMIFNAEMVRAILDGRKTQTRRIMKVQPEPSKSRPGDFWFSSKKLESMVHVSDLVPGNSPVADCHLFFQEHCCPFGTVGDRIWVRETFCAVPDHEEPTGCSALLYAADGNGPYGKWTPSIHMPRFASRILLEISDVRVERLNSMSEDDARAEGCCGGHDSIPGYMYSATPHEHFHHIWTSIYGDDSWQANPWVWVIEFKRIEGDDHATD
ncbi:TPA: hypothetical protein QCH82_002892 [Enterobacter kobei]|nr:hypothetical protein [Enterobacter kobei]